MRFVDDPRIPMDNNASERAGRGPAVARKNFYGSGSLWSGRLAATVSGSFLLTRQALAAMVSVGLDFLNSLAILSRIDCNPLVLPIVGASGKAVESDEHGKEAV